MCRHSYGTEVVAGDLAFTVDGKIVCRVSREEFLEATRPTAIEDMRRAVDSMDREAASLRARIAEAEGKPRHARFLRVCAGLEEGSIAAAKLEARAESYLRHRVFYAHESAETREAVLDLVKAMEEATMSPVAVEIANLCAAGAGVSR